MGPAAGGRGGAGVTAVVRDYSPTGADWLLAVEAEERA